MSNDQNCRCDYDDPPVWMLRFGAWLWRRIYNLSPDLYYRLLGYKENPEKE